MAISICHLSLAFLKVANGFESQVTVWIKFVSGANSLESYIHQKTEI